MNAAVTIREIQLDAEDYPPRLRTLPDAPAKIWARGALPEDPSVAIVGTRRASRDAIAFTERLAAELAQAGASVVSGGAAGIDTAAHEGALRARGVTIVVQAAPLEAPYPRRNANLFDRVIEQGGGWLSETPPGKHARPFRFLARNRLIAALADVVIVVQAPARSGALSTARWARELERPVLAVPGAPWDPRAEGVVGFDPRRSRPLHRARRRRSASRAEATLARFCRPRGSRSWRPSPRRCWPPWPTAPATSTSSCAALSSRRRASRSR